MYKCSAGVVITNGDYYRVLLLVLDHRYLVELFVVEQYAVLSSPLQAMSMSSSHMFDFYPMFVSLLHLSEQARIDQLRFRRDTNQ